MSNVMNLHKDSKTKDTKTQQSDGDSTSFQQDLEDLENRLVALSDKIKLCQLVQNDLKALSDTLVSKCLEDVSLQPQK